MSIGILQFIEKECTNIDMQNRRSSRRGNDNTLAVECSYKSPVYHEHWARSHAWKRLCDDIIVQNIHTNTELLAFETAVPKQTQYLPAANMIARRRAEPVFTLECWTFGGSGDLLRICTPWIESLCIHHAESSLQVQSEYIL